MGQTLVAVTKADARVTFAGGSEREAIKAEFPLVTNAAELIALGDAVIDFTAPENSLAIAKAAAAKGSVHIIGTTGFTSAQEAELVTYAKTARIVKSGNFSLGVNVVEKLVEQAAKLLDANYDIELFEMHHKHKKDAPSGTALMLGDAAARGRGVVLADKKVIDRDGVRKVGDIGFSVARGGDVVGIHTVTFAGAGEVIELKHQGFSREIYATGALHAALWAANKPAGLYTMRDVVG
jgi:4-hydroxy-tetrahydrodipicolinate reductase